MPLSCAFRERKIKGVVVFVCNVGGLLRHDLLSMLELFREIL